MRQIWEWWRSVARRIGDFQARLILSVLYFIIVGPFALVVRWGADPLSIKRGTRKGWWPKPESAGLSLNRAMNQF